VSIVFIEYSEDMLKKRWLQVRLSNSKIIHFSI